jgi:L-fuculokinase
VINGIGLNSKRQDIYLSALTSLAEKAREGVKILETIGNFKAESVILVGGGAKNRLWNQLKADHMGIPVKIIDQKETTIVGAALFALSGAGLYKTPKEARNAMKITSQLYIPAR